MSTLVHPTALVHDKAVLGQDVMVGPYAVIEENTELGDKTRLDAFAQVKAHTVMGRENHVHSYACVGGVPQDLKFKGEVSRLQIGYRNTIREYVTLNRGTEGGGGITSIGSNCLLMAYVHVAHDCQIGDEVVFSNGATLAGHVVVGSHAIIGGLSAVHQFVRVGEHAFVGGKTGVAQDIPPYMLAVGERAKLHGPNLVGLRRMKLSTETIQALKNTFRILFRSENSRKEALAEVEEKLGHVPEVRRILEFVRQSQRGITPAT
ncbi:MAG: acyl-ACP--UDP-N-acetylglucosamine O-acyltransferase [Desulfovibrionales bacterium]